LDYSKSKNNKMPKKSKNIDICCCRILDYSEPNTTKNIKNTQNAEKNPGINYLLEMRHQTEQVDDWKHHPQIKKSYEERRWKSNHKNQKNCNKETIYVYDPISSKKKPIVYVTNHHGWLQYWTENEGYIKNGELQQRKTWNW
jgi:hypothetical protein